MLGLSLNRGFSGSKANHHVTSSLVLSSLILFILSYFSPLLCNHGQEAVFIRRKSFSFSLLRNITQATSLSFPLDLHATSTPERKAPEDPRGDPGKPNAARWTAQPRFHLGQAPFTRHGNKLSSHGSCPEQVNTFIGKNSSFPHLENGDNSSFVKRLL